MELDVRAEGDLAAVDEAVHRSRQQRLDAELAVAEQQTDGAPSPRLGRVHDVDTLDEEDGVGHAEARAENVGDERLGLERRRRDIRYIGGWAGDRDLGSRG